MGIDRPHDANLRGVRVSSPRTNQRRFEPEASPGVPQFTLRGFFSFVTAVAVCLSLIATASRAGGIAERLLWVVVVFFFWAILLETYRRVGLKAAFLCHLIVLGIFVGLSLLIVFFYLLAWVILTDVGDPLADVYQFVAAVWLMAAIYGCLAGSLLSLTVTAATVLAAIKKAGRRHNG
jgi:hypothetical protein